MRRVRHREGDHRVENNFDLLCLRVYKLYLSSPLVMKLDYADPQQPIDFLWQSLTIPFDYVSQFVGFFL